MSDDLPCPVEECDTVCTGIRRLVRHVRSNHSVCPNLTLSCPVSPCASVFRTAETFRKHVMSRHANAYARTVPICVNNVDPPCDSFEDDHIGNSHDQLKASALFENVLSALDQRTSTLRLHLEHTFDLPNSIACRIYDEVILFGLSLSKDLSEAALLRMSEVGFTDALLERILDPPGLDTICKATRRGDMSTFLKVGYVGPVEYDLVQLAAECGQPAVYAGATKPVMYYVPMLETLKSTWVMRMFFVV